MRRRCVRIACRTQSAHSSTIKSVLGDITCLKYFHCWHHILLSIILQYNRVLRVEHTRYAFEQERYSVGESNTLAVGVLQKHYACRHNAPFFTYVLARHQIREILVGRRFQLTIQIRAELVQAGLVFIEHREQLKVALCIRPVVRLNCLVDAFCKLLFQFLLRRLEHCVAFEQ